MLLTWSLALGILAGLNWGASQFIESHWTQGFFVGVAAIILGDIARSVEERWIHGPPAAASFDWSAEDPATVAAARAICTVAPRDGPPCAPCMAMAKRAVRAYQARQAG